MSSKEPASGEVPYGWTTHRIQKVLEHYEGQTEDDAIREDEAAYDTPGQCMMPIPVELLPEVRKLLAKKRAA